MGFPTKNDHVGVLWGVPPFKETPIYRLEFISSCAIFNLSNLHSDKDRQGLPNQLATFWWNSLPSAPPWCHGNHVQKLEEIKGATPRQHFVGEILLDWIWPNYIIFHQPTFAWSKGISLTNPPFGVRSSEVAIIWPDWIVKWATVQQKPDMTFPIPSMYLPTFIIKINQM